MTLKIRILLVSSFAILLVALSLIIAGKLSGDEAEGRFEQTALLGKHTLWKKVVSAQLERMQSAISSLTRNRKALKAVQSGDTAAIGDLLIGTFNRLSTAGTISKLQVVDAQGSVLFSKPTGELGSQRSGLAAAALATNEIRAGLERDDDGRLKAVLTTPLYHRGKPVGAGVFIYDLQSAVEDFKANDGADVFLLNPRRRSGICDRSRASETGRYRAPRVGQPPDLLPGHRGSGVFGGHAGRPRFPW